jgi:hypothetical protein
MEKEQELQCATDEYLGEVNGRHCATIDRILRQQRQRLGANVALLEQRFDMLPHPERFQSWSGRHIPPTAKRRVPEPESIVVLPRLVVQHLRLARHIEALITCSSDREHGELILTQVGRNHDEMAGILTTLLKGDETVRDLEPLPALGVAPAPPVASAPAENWENEGGALRPPTAAATTTPVAEMDGAGTTTVPGISKAA